MKVFILFKLKVLSISLLNSNSIILLFDFDGNCIISLSFLPCRTDFVSLVFCWVLLGVFLYVFNSDLYFFF